MGKFDNVSTVVVAPTYNCNDICTFCFSEKYLNKSPTLSMDQVREYYECVAEKHDIDNVIITGGEPSVYPQFWELMDYFYNEVGENIRPALNTNSLRFADKLEANKMQEFLKNCKSERRQLSLSLSTVNNFADLETYEKKKIAGFTRLVEAGLKTDTNLTLVIIVTKKNYKTLPYLARFLSKIIDYKSHSQVRLFLRYPFAGAPYMTQKQMDEDIEYDFSKVSPFISLFLNAVIQIPNLSINLFNLPLCHFKNSLDLNDEAVRNKFFATKMENRIRINFKFDKNNIEGSVFHEDISQIDACNTCSFQEHCSRVQQKYLDMGVFETLYPFDL